MSRRKAILAVAVAAVLGATVAHVAAPGGSIDVLVLLGAAIVAGELLALRLEDGGAIPLSYSVLVVLAAVTTAPRFAVVVLGAELVVAAGRLLDGTVRSRLLLFATRLAVAGATLGVFRALVSVAGPHQRVAVVLGTLGGAAISQVVVDVLVRRVLHLPSTFSPRGRLAWLAIASSGMLMAVGYTGVDGAGRLGVWGPLLFCTPLLGAWYAFERLDAATRSYHQTIEALAMAPELGGLVPAGHAQRVASLARDVGEVLGLHANEVRDLEMAALLHHLGEVTLDAPRAVPADASDGGVHREVAHVTGELMRGIRPLANAGDIVAGDADEPRRRLAVQVLRIASEYDDLTARDSTPSALAVESLRVAASYEYEGRVIDALERAVAR